MLKIDYTLFFQIANFLILLFVLNIVLFRPIRKILSRRSDEINAFRKTIEDFQGKSAKYSKDLEENILGANREGYREKEDLKGKGLEAEKEMLQEANASVEEKIGKAKEEIQANVLNARQSLEADVGVFSKELAEKILGRSI